MSTTMTMEKGNHPYSTVWGYPYVDFITRFLGKGTSRVTKLMYMFNMKE